MLERATRLRAGEDQGFPDARSDQPHFSTAELAAFVRRYLGTIVLCTVAALAVAVLYVRTSVPMYTARAQLLIDPRSAQLFREQLREVDLSLDNAQVESEIAVIRSEAVVTRVIDALHLKSDPEFQGRKGRLGQLLAWIGWSDDDEPPTEYERSRLAVSAFEYSLDVRRVGLSHVIEVSMTLADPEKAARVVNATTDAYIREQLEARAEAARRGGDWLEERLVQLRDQMQLAARAVQQFKAEHNIVDVGTRGLLDDQRLSELNSQLVLARARTADARARLTRIEEILASGFPDAAVVEVLGNQVINGLRVRYLDAETREAELAKRYGRDHPAAANLRSEMQDFQRAMSQELQRIGETYKSDYEIAKAREESVDAELARLVRETAASRRAQIKLTELETSAQTYRRIYESFLQQFTESTQRQSFPIANTRVITEATKPLGKSYPRTGLVMALATLVGALGGVGLALVRHGLDRSVQAADQIRNEVGVECLGLVPRIVRGDDERRPWRNGGPLLAGVRRFVRTQPTSFLTEVEAFPFSRFSDALRGVKTSISIANHTKALRCIGITSSSPGEGKSTLASNLARLYAMGGVKVLLVDADVRNATLTRALAPQARGGLIEALRGVKPHDLIVVDAASGLHFMPVVCADPIAHSADLLGSECMTLLLEELRGSYDSILVDLPPLVPTVDARAVSPLLDAIVLIAEWGRTPVGAVASAMQSLGSARARVLGAVINKADARAVRAQQPEYTPYYP
ncbi:GNVR domain-containing protein [Chelatococcus sp. SYSU_G07232]|uniref:GNVR domain-containing protein n=1 Tax=Chelatococcus albus TaxID=3047466 RepID=A0ABT7ACJ9_9HYPH|nr:GNVR domain-containing protein [Chelatococcus sp. SYSU_G07232]MDJ1157096.1 GNVR domain-containing protein [Chelatococcus sp. SYSU_G07232]